MEADDHSETVLTIHHAVESCPAARWVSACDSSVIGSSGLAQGASANSPLSLRVARRQTGFSWSESQTSHFAYVIFLC